MRRQDRFKAEISLNNVTIDAALMRSPVIGEGSSDREMVVDETCWLHLEMDVKVLQEPEQALSLLHDKPQNTQEEAIVHDFS